MTPAEAFARWLDGEEVDERLVRAEVRATLRTLATVFLAQPDLVVHWEIEADRQNVPESDRWLQGYRRGVAVGLRKAARSLGHLHYWLQLRGAQGADK